MDAPTSSRKTPTCPSRARPHDGRNSRAARNRTATIMPPRENAPMLAGRPVPADGQERAVVPSPTVTVPRLRPRDPVARAVILALEAALSRIRSIEPEARRGDVEGIHRLRTTTRRLRSELRAFRDLVDPEWVGPLEGELKWLAGLLGGVRDLDVLTARLREAAGIPEDGSPPEDLVPLFAHLAARHARATRELRGALQSERYRDLLAAIEHAAERPSLGADSCTPCKKALPPVAAAAWRKLKECARALKPDDPDEAFHEVRKRAKRARYLAEMVAAVLKGSDARGARRFIRGTTRVQDVLGEHQDAIVAGDEISSVLARHTAGEPVERASRELLEGQTEAAQSAREDFFDVWNRVDRKKSRGWLKAAR